MNNEDLIIALKTHLISKPINSSITKLEKALPGISILLNECYGNSLSEKIWNLLYPNDYKKFSTCPTCGKETKKFISSTTGYQLYCGISCSKKISIKKQQVLLCNEELLIALKNHLEFQPVNSSIFKLEKTIPGISKILESCPGIKLGEKIWNLLNPNQYERFSTCPTCGKETKKFISLTSGYRQFCGNNCASKDPNISKARSNSLKDPINIRKRIKTQKENNDSGNGLKGMRNKVAKILSSCSPGNENKIATIKELEAINLILPTVKQNCFSILPLSHPELYSLIKDFYGLSFSEKIFNAINPGIRNKHLNCIGCNKKLDSYITLKKGYRIYCSNLCSMSHDPFKQKALSQLWSIDSKKNRSNTLIEKYGTDSMIDINRTKSIASMQEKYGVDYPGQSQEIRDKTKAVVIEKYGVDNVWKVPKVRAKCTSTLLENHGVTSPLQLVDWSQINVTKWQDELSFILTEIGITHLLNDRTKIYPLEIDIYCPDLKIGIELNGLYWHTESQGKNSSYHLLKQQKCEDQGIRLIQISEDEWIHKKMIIIGRLLAILGKAERIFARKCTIEKIPYKEAVLFLNETHIQGMVSGSHNIGLRYNGELVSLLVVGSPRFDKKYKWELFRYSSKIGVSVIGGAGRLLAYFSRNNKGSIISYADRMWSNGNLYQTLGFTEKSRTAPSPFYVDLKNMIRLSVYKVRGEKIKRYVPDNIYDPRLTESANMQLAGYERTFDCGSLVYIKN